MKPSRIRSTSGEQIGRHRDRVSASGRWALRRDVAVAPIQATGTVKKCRLQEATDHVLTSLIEERLFDPASHLMHTAPSCFRDHTNTAVALIPTLPPCSAPVSALPSFTAPHASLISSSTYIGLVALYSNLSNCIPSFAATCSASSTSISAVKGPCTTRFGWPSISRVQSRS